MARRSLSVRPRRLDAAYRRPATAGPARRVRSGPRRWRCSPRRSRPLVESRAPCSPDIAAGAEFAAQAVADYLRITGRRFYDEIVDGTGCCGPRSRRRWPNWSPWGSHQRQLRGTSRAADPSEKRKPLGGRRRHRRAIFDIADSGRWALQKRSRSSPRREHGRSNPPAGTRASRAGALLRRYGVVFWRAAPSRRCMAAAMARDAARASTAWRRAAKFAADASSRACRASSSRCRKRSKLLRKTRRAPATGRVRCGQRRRSAESRRHHAAGRQSPALTGNRVLYLDGIAVATLVGGAVQWLEPLDAGQRNSAESLLIQRRTGAPLLAYLR